MQNNPQYFTLQDRKVGCSLMLGIFVMPYIFAWFTLGDGYSKRVRVISFIWLAFIVLIGIGGAMDKKNNSTLAVTDTPTNTPQKINQNTPSDKITLAKFKMLETGMDYTQARRILGKQGTLTGQNQFGNTITESYHWDCGFMCGVDLIFQDFKLVQKTQIGLEE